MKLEWTGYRGEPIGVTVGGQAALELGSGGVDSEMLARQQTYYEALISGKG